MGRGTGIVLIIESDGVLFADPENDKLFVPDYLNDDDHVPATVGAVYTGAHGQTACQAASFYTVFVGFALRWISS